MLQTAENRHENTYMCMRGDKGERGKEALVPGMRSPPILGDRIKEVVNI